MSYYIHHVPGRLRIRTARLHRAECQAKLGKRLGELPGIGGYSHNAKAGRVLIHYDTARLTISASPDTTSAGSHLIKQAGALFGAALFGTLLRKSVETSVMSLARGFR